MSMVFDEYGRPFIIVRDQEQKERIKGIDAIKVFMIRACVFYKCNAWIEQYFGCTDGVISFENFIRPER